MLSTERHEELTKGFSLKNNDIFGVTWRLIYLEYVWFYLFCTTMYAGQINKQVSIQKLILRIRPYILDLSYRVTKASGTKDNFSKSFFDGVEEANNYYFDNLDLKADPYTKGSPDYLITKKIFDELDEAIKEDVFKEFMTQAHVSIEDFMKHGISAQVKKALK